MKRRDFNKGFVGGLAGLVAVLFVGCGNKKENVDTFDIPKFSIEPDMLKPSGKVTQGTFSLINKHGTNREEKSLIYSVMKTSSSFNPYAISRDGAVGLMQLMPYTAKEHGINTFKPFTEEFYFGLEPKERKEFGKQYKRDLKSEIMGKTHKEIVDIDKRFDTNLNIRIGANILKGLLEKYGSEKEEDRIKQALVGYYSGDNVVQEYKTAVENGNMKEFKEKHTETYKFLQMTHSTFKRSMNLEYKSFNEFIGI